jgi:hypothetical protein
LWVGFAIVLVLSLALAGAVAADDQVPVLSKVIALVWIPGMFTSMYWGPMLAGLPGLQLWLDVTEEGLDYGGRRLVPWSVVTDLADHKIALLGRRQTAFVLQGWRPTGSLARFMYKGAVPLEYFTPRWRSFGVVEAVARWAPHVVIRDDNAPPAG